MKANISHAALFEMLSELPPMDVLAIGLRQRQREGEVIERKALDEATRQLLAYTTNCKQAGNHVAGLPAVPALDDSLVAEYPL